MKIKNWKIWILSCKSLKELLKVLLKKPLSQSILLLLVLRTVKLLLPIYIQQSIFFQVAQLMVSRMESKRSVKQSKSYQTLLLNAELVKKNLLKLQRLSHHCWINLDTQWLLLIMLERMLLLMELKSSMKPPMLSQIGTLKTMKILEDKLDLSYTNYSSNKLN